MKAYRDIRPSKLEQFWFEVLIMKVCGVFETENTGGGGGGGGRRGVRYSTSSQNTRVGFVEAIFDANCLGGRVGDKLPAYSQYLRLTLYSKYQKTKHVLVAWRGGRDWFRGYSTFWRTRSGKSPPPPRPRSLSYVWVDLGRQRETYLICPGIRPYPS